MEGNNWRPAASQGEPAFDSTSEDWRSQLHPDARQRIVNKIMETLKRHFPISGPEDIKKIAVRFEEKIYTAATNQSDYLRRISVKMLSMESKTQGTVATNSSPSNLGVANSNPANSVDPSNVLLVRTPSPPDSRDRTVVIPPLPPNLPLETRQRWLARATIAINYAARVADADTGDTLATLESKLAQANKDLEVVQTQLQEMGVEKAEAVKLVADLEAKKADLDAAMEKMVEDQIDLIEKTKRIVRKNKEAWEAEKKSLLNQIEQLKKSAVSSSTLP